jgi:hypothetical protein
MPLIIRGARQVGKSTLVRMFCKENNLELTDRKYPTIIQLYQFLNVSIRYGHGHQLVTLNFTYN